MMNPYMRNRRFSYTEAQMLPSSIHYNRNVNNERNKMVNSSICLILIPLTDKFFSFSQYEESSPPPKRTKRKTKPDPPTAKQDSKNEIIKVNQIVSLSMTLFHGSITECHTSSWISSNLWWN
jgi:hypothetical protein